MTPDNRYIVHIVLSGEWGEGSSIEGVCADEAAAAAMVARLAEEDRGRGGKGDGYYIETWTVLASGSEAKP